MDLSVEIIGIIGASLTTASFVPQVYKVVKTKSVEGISLTMYLVFFIGILFWLYYGLKIESFSVIMANIKQVSWCLSSCYLEYFTEIKQRKVIFENKLILKNI